MIRLNRFFYYTLVASLLIEPVAGFGATTDPRLNRAAALEMARGALGGDLGSELQIVGDTIVIESQIKGALPLRVTVHYDPVDNKPVIQITGGPRPITEKLNTDFLDQKLKANRSVIESVLSGTSVENAIDNRRILQELLGPAAEALMIQALEAAAAATGTTDGLYHGDRAYFDGAPNPGQPGQFDEQPIQPLPTQGRKPVFSKIREASEVLFKTPGQLVKRAFNGSVITATWSGFALASVLTAGYVIANTVTLVGVGYAISDGAFLSSKVWPTVEVLVGTAIYTYTWTRLYKLARFMHNLAIENLADLRDTKDDSSKTKLSEREAKMRQEISALRAMPEGANRRQKIKTVLKTAPALLRANCALLLIKTMEFLGP